MAVCLDSLLQLIFDGSKWEWNSKCGGGHGGGDSSSVNDTTAAAAAVASGTRHSNLQFLFRSLLFVPVRVLLRLPRANTGASSNIAFCSSVLDAILEV